MLRARVRISTASGPVTRVLSCPVSVDRVCSTANLSAFRYGSGASTTDSITVKIAAFAPIPNASVSVAVAKNSGLFTTCLTADFTSAQKFLIAILSSAHMLNFTP